MKALQMIRPVVSPFFRIINRAFEGIFSSTRKFYFRMLYPSISIKGKSHISAGVHIFCSNQSKIQITNSFIAANVTIEAKHNGQVIIKNSYIGPNSVIVAVDSIVIEDDCMIAEMVVIRDQNHTIETGKSILDSKLNSSPIHIHKNVWLGAKSTVLKGSVIEENVIVGAHSLVNSSLARGTVAVGTPAKPLHPQ